MNAIDKPKVFGKIGLADVLLLFLGGGIGSNITALFVRTPQAAVVGGYAAMLLGLLAARCGDVMGVRLVQERFADHPKRTALVRAFRFTYAALLVVAWVASKFALDERLRALGA